MFIRDRTAMDRNDSRLLLQSPAFRWMEERAASCLRLLAAMLAAACLAGCEVVKGIFDAGMWVGVIGIIVLLVIVGAILSLFRR